MRKREVRMKGIHKIAVLLGGDSTEREISLKSGEAVWKSLLRNGYEAIKVDPREGKLYEQLSEIKPDLVFIALHGKGGEDGTIQGFLEHLNIPYTGSGVLASALTMNKIYTQSVLRDGGITVPDFFWLDRKMASALGISGLVVKIKEELGFPVLVKAPSQGSSLGIYFINKEDRSWEAQLEEALAGAFALEDRIMIEKMIFPSDEITIGLLGNEQAYPLPTLEITTVSGYYDYESKYTKGLCQHIIPARIDAGMRNLAKEQAVAAYQLLGCRGFARADFMVTREKAYLIDINTIPGFTEMSLLPDAAKAIGISFDALTEYIVSMAAGQEFPYEAYQDHVFES